MARIRSIKPDFWTSEQVACCSIPARLTFIAIWTYADDSGRLRYSPTQLKMRAFSADAVTPDEVAKWVGELEHQGLVLTYEVDGDRYLQVTGWHHQAINRPTPSKLPAAPENPSETTDVPRGVSDDSRSAHGGLTEDSLGKEGRREGRKDLSMREGGREGAAGRRGNGSAASAVKAGDVAQDLISDLGESSPGQRAGDELERAATCAALYNTLLPSLQSATPPERWSDLRWHRFRELARKVDVCEQSMRAYFEDVARQPFLLGQTGGKFRADLTWLLEFEHFLAVAEGRYTDRDDD